MPPRRYYEVQLKCCIWPWSHEGQIFRANRIRSPGTKDRAIFVLVGKVVLFIHMQGHTSLCGLAQHPRHWGAGLLSLKKTTLFGSDPGERRRSDMRDCDLARPGGLRFVEENTCPECQSAGSMDVFSSGSWLKRCASGYGDGQRSRMKQPAFIRKPSIKSYNGNIIGDKITSRTFLSRLAFVLACRP
jgi:hypothetical protein